MTKEVMKLALEAYCKTLHPLWNAGISRTEAEGFFNAGFKAAEALAKQEPLTDEQIVVIVREASHGSAIRREGSTSMRIARAIEAAHGIKEYTHDRS